MKFFFLVDCCAYRNLIGIIMVAGLAHGCAKAPQYVRPNVATPTAYKEAPDWITAAPANLLDRDPWWQLFNDPMLNQLEAEVTLSNQNIVAATAAYAQARALVREQRAALFPLITLNGVANYSGNNNSNGSSNGNSVGGTSVRNNYQANLGASWEPDVWGRLHHAAENAGAGAQASAADLAAATLSTQGALAVNYFSLRLADAQITLMNATIDGYRRTLQIAQNRHAAGVTPKTDLLQAQTQLANAQAEKTGFSRQRAQLEHALAILLGKAPANFNLPSSNLLATVPEVPVGIPSALLQRRPDIAAAERRVAAANEGVGVAQAAFYPNIILSASTGVGQSRLAELFSLSNSTWSFGLSIAQTLFNAGATRARVDASQAAHLAEVARYRQTVLRAFQEVEDQLSATRVLREQQSLRQQAVQFAEQVEMQVLNQYRAGRLGYTEVVTAQTSVLIARRALVQLQAERLSTAAILIQSLGGSWKHDVQKNIVQIKE